MNPSAHGTEDKRNKGSRPRADKQHADSRTFHDGHILRGRTRVGKALVLAAAISVLVCSILQAEGDTQAGKEPGSEIDAHVAATYNGMYVWRGLREVDGPVLQPSATVEYEGLTAHAWGNMDMSDVNGHDEHFTEIDASLDYTWDVNPLDLSAGTIYYTFPHGPANHSTLEVYASAGLDWPLSPALTVYQDVDEAGGTYGTVSAGHTFEDLFRPVEEIPIGLQLNGSLAYGSSGFNEYYYHTDSAGMADLLLKASFPVHLSEKMSLKPSVNYSSLLDADIRDNVHDPESLWAGLTLEYSF